MYNKTLSTLNVYFWNNDSTYNANFIANDKHGAPPDNGKNMSGKLLFDISGSNTTFIRTEDGRFLFHDFLRLIDDPVLLSPTITNNAKQVFEWTFEDVPNKPSKKFISIVDSWRDPSVKYYLGVCNFMFKLYEKFNITPLRQEAFEWEILDSMIPPL
jgi:hypothetical protein